MPSHGRAFRCAAAERSSTLQALRRDDDSGTEVPLSKADILAWGHADSGATAALAGSLLVKDWSQHVTNLKVRSSKLAAFIVRQQLAMLSGSNGLNH